MIGAATQADEAGQSFFDVSERRTQQHRHSNRRGCMSSSSVAGATTSAKLMPEASLKAWHARPPRLAVMGQPFGNVFRSALRGTPGLADLHPTTPSGGGPDPRSLSKRRRVERADGLAPPTSPLDPVVRQTAHLAPPSAVAMPEPSSSALVEVRAHVSLEEMLPAIARRVAWSNDGRRGAVRIELGGGRLAGTTLVVTSEDGRVSVDLEMPSTVATYGWQQRIADRLRSRGLDVDSIDVR